MYIYNNGKSWGGGGGILSGEREILGPETRTEFRSSTKFERIPAHNVLTELNVI